MEMDMLADQYTRTSFSYHRDHEWPKSAHTRPKEREKRLEKRKEKFREAVKDAVKKSKKDKKGGGERNSVMAVSAILKKVEDEEDQQHILLHRFPVKDKKTKDTVLVDGIQLALKFNSLKLFYALLKKVNSREYLNEYGLLELAIMSKDDEQLAIVLRVYKEHEVRVCVASLRKEAHEALFNSSWSMDIIELLYPHANQFFIPRGQLKAKMFAFVCYNTFNPGTDEHPRRVGAREEADSIMKGLQDCGFTLRGPLIDWTFDQLLQYLRQHITEVRDKCSVLFICLMSHGDKGVLYDKDGKRGKINRILDELNGLRTITPAVLLVQACQGENKPDQGVDIDYERSVIDGPPVDAQPKNKPTGGPQAEATDSELIKTLERRLEKYNCHISVTRPNTMLVAATAESYYATRSYFLKHMAKLLEDVDGETTFNRIVQLCSRDMSLHPDEECRKQAPATYELLRQPLVLPRSAAYQKKQAEKASEPGKGPGKRARAFNIVQQGAELVIGKVKDKFCSKPKS